jgi:hypothetical protein
MRTKKIPAGNILTKCINTCALEFAKSVDNCELHRHRTQQSHPLRIADGLYPSVETSMIMACTVNILQLSVKYRRTVSVSRNVVDCALCMINYVCIAYLSSCKHLNYKLPAHNNNHSEHYKINISCYKISSIILHYKTMLYTFVFWLVRIFFFFFFIN